METQEDKHRLESVECGNHVYKYIWTPCLGEQLSLCVNVENAHVILFCFGDKRCEMMDQIQKINCSDMTAIFCVTHWML